MKIGQGRLGLTKSILTLRRGWRRTTLVVGVLGRASLASAEKVRLMGKLFGAMVDEGGVEAKDVGDTEAGGVPELVWRGDNGDRGDGGSNKGERWAWLRGELAGDPLGDPFRGKASEGRRSKSLVSIRSPWEKLYNSVS